MVLQINASWKFPSSFPSDKVRHLEKVFELLLLVWKRCHIAHSTAVGLSLSELLSKKLKDWQKQLVPFLPFAFSLDKTRGQKHKCWLSNNGVSTLSTFGSRFYWKENISFPFQIWLQQPIRKEEIAACLALAAWEEQRDRKGAQLFTPYHLFRYQRTPVQLLFPSTTSP